MAPGNAQIVRPIHGRWGRGDWPPVFEIYHPEMKWGWSDEFPDLGGVYVDPVTPNSRLRRWLSEWEHWRAEPDDFLEIGDHVLVLARYIGRRKGSGHRDPSGGSARVPAPRWDGDPAEIFASRARALEYVRSMETASP